MEQSLQCQCVSEGIWSGVGKRLSSGATEGPGGMSSSGDPWELPSFFPQASVSSSKAGLCGRSWEKAGRQTESLTRAQSGARRQPARGSCAPEGKCFAVVGRWAHGQEEEGVQEDASQPG